MLARRFQHVERARRVDAKIGRRIARGPVVRRLGRGVDHQRDVAAAAPKDLVELCAVADVDVVVLVVGEVGLEPLSAPDGGSRFAEEVAPQVVVDSDDVHAQMGEEARGLRADQTHALLDYPWGKTFRYDEAVLSGDGPGGFVKASLTAGGTGLMMSALTLGPARNLLGRIAPSPGEGPSPETIRNGFFEIELFASHPEDPEKNLTAVVTGDRDPGYGSTSKMIAESAVCLALDELSTPTGVLTPTVAMGMQLVKRLQENAVERCERYS